MGQNLGLLGEGGRERGERKEREAKRAPLARSAAAKTGRQEREQRKGGGWMQKFTRRWLAARPQRRAGTPVPSTPPPATFHYFHIFIKYIIFIIFKSTPAPGTPPPATFHYTTCYLERGGHEPLAPRGVGTSASDEE